MTTVRRVPDPAALLPPIEPFRVKAVEQVHVRTRAERDLALSRANLNLFALRSEDVTIDLLTDSGTCAMSAAQWGALLTGDEAYAGSPSFERFDKAVREIFGFEYVLPVHQGRAAERLMIAALCSPGDAVPANAHFQTTRANLESFGVHAVDLPSPEFWQFAEPLPFKGNLDTVALERFLGRNGRAKTPFVLITLTNNPCADQPVSMENIRTVRAITSEHGLPLYFDACRFALNAWLIRAREPAYARASVPELVREMFSYADGCLFSAKKDGLAHTGGFLATRSKPVAERAAAQLLLAEGFLTYGGMTGRDLDAIAIGLRDALDEEYLRYRIDTTAYLGTRLIAESVPIIAPPGGHAVYLDVAQIVGHLSPEQNPGQALAIEIYREGGVRTLRMGLRPGPEAGRQEPVELVRLALPARVYTRNHLDYVARVVGNVVRRAGDLSGVQSILTPSLLGGFRSIAGEAAKPG